MGFSGDLALILSVFLLMRRVRADAGNVRNYITWDDMKVDEKKLNTNFGNQEGGVIVVDQQGSGHSLTVQGAVNMVPENNTRRVKIYIYPGVYREKVIVPKSKSYISLIGKRNQTGRPVIVWNNKASDRGPDGQILGTYATATVGVESDYFCAADLTIENSVVAVPSGHGMQAVALRIDSDRAVFYRVRIFGAQDTLLDSTGTHFFYKCHIRGSVDFIFGSAKSLYQSCLLESIAKGYGAIAAHHRDSPQEDTGFFFLGCAIRGSPRVYLGRAWGNYARIIYSFCYMDDIIYPEGWTEWNHPSRKMTAVFAEYQCAGRGADRSRRVPWSKSFSSEEVTPFLGKSFINGDWWLRL